MSALAAADLRLIGEALYGPEWQSSLARALDLHRNSVARYATGTRPIPATVTTRLLALVADRQSALAQLLQQLRRAS
jgi:plasmid maintenance system antidote protein VapI